MYIWSVLVVAKFNTCNCLTLQCKYNYSCHMCNKLYCAFNFNNKGLSLVRYMGQQASQ